MDDKQRDTDAVNRVLAGDKESYRDLVEHHQNRLFGLCVRLVGNPTEAMDLAQQSFIEAYGALGRFDPARSFGSWLSSIAINNCKDYLKSHKRKETQLAPEIEVAGAMFMRSAQTPERALESREQMARLAAAIANLDPKYRIPLVLKDVEELEYSEIQAMLDLPLTTLKMRVVRARKQLLEALSWTEES